MINILMLFFEVATREVLPDLFLHKEKTSAAKTLQRMHADYYDF